MSNTEIPTLPWHEIEKQFDREWVQLVQYDWPEEEPLPRSGVVRVHAKTRREFDELILRDSPDTTALLFVGERSIPKGTVLSANHHQWKPLGA